MGHDTELSDPESQHALPMWVRDQKQQVQRSKQTIFQGSKLFSDQEKLTILLMAGQGREQGQGAGQARARAEVRVDAAPHLQPECLYDS